MNPTATTLLGLPLSGRTPFALHSNVDDSVNWVTTNGQQGQALEARFVRRTADIIVVYISTQTACRQGCRFCHLTATGQVKATDATVEEILEQAHEVLGYFDTELAAGRQAPARAVHFNCMARGEALDSTVVRTQADTIIAALYQLGRERGLTPSVRLSTIGPKNLDVPLRQLFPVLQPDMYYSVYSMDPQFRQHWLPNAGEPRQFLDMLAELQATTSKIPVIHHALIAGHNDDPQHARDIVAAVNAAKLRVDVNLVAYNPAGPSHGQEAAPHRYLAHASTYERSWPTANVKIIKRVGVDVAASCGMFVGGRIPAGTGHAHA